MSDYHQLLADYRFTRVNDGTTFRSPDGLASVNVNDQDGSLTVTALTAFSPQLIRWKVVIDNAEPDVLDNASVDILDAALCAADPQLASRVHSG
ncbi:hypothetical protein [Amycolatopsis pithecellobii]|uniref:Uncharacterized protein n=1 Tax=Amycolatopsis pithecellobii TaxID=664692 RepID=A0A6N7Z1E6_9PSEU|nr:hypothetical protein [Amycolatopsis pithecellobii]MTD58168.1 hypothetical protein [Amycolatopsis pithecellobii]